jgi:hypothetical protein
LLGKITEEEEFLPFPKDELRKQSEQMPLVNIKTFGLYSTLFEEEIVIIFKTT